MRSSARSSPDHGPSTASDDENVSGRMQGRKEMRMFRHLRKLRLRSILTLGIAVLPTCVGVAVAVKTPAGNGSVFPSRLPAPTVNERAGEVDLVAQRAAEISTPAVVINVDGRLEAFARGIDSAFWDIL